MRTHNDAYAFGDAVEYNEEEELIDSPTFANNNTLGTKEGGKRIGDIHSGVQKHMEEGEDSASFVDGNEKQQMDAILDDYKEKIKSAVSARLLGKKINLKLSGNRALIEQIVKLIKLETDYLSSIMSGQGADAPILIKMKTEIDVEASKLDRMLGTTDFWPFK